MKANIYNLLIEYLEYSTLLDSVDKRNWKRSRKVSLKTNKNAKEKRKSYAKKIALYKKKTEETELPSEKKLYEIKLRQYILKHRDNNQ